MLQQPNVELIVLLMVEDVNCKDLTRVVSSDLPEIEVSDLYGSGNVFVGAQANLRKLFIVLHNDDGSVGPHCADEVGVLVYLHDVDDVELPEVRESGVRPRIELPLKLLAEHIAKGFRQLVPVVQYFVAQQLGIRFGLLLIELKPTVVDEKRGSFHPVHFGVVVTQDDLLQLQLPSFPVRLGILSVNDVGNAAVSLPVVGAENHFADSLNVDVEEVGFGLIVFVTQIGHADGESLLLSVVPPDYGLHAQRGSLIVIGLIEGDDFPTDVADCKVQGCYMWLKIANIL